MQQLERVCANIKVKWSQLESTYLPQLNKNHRLHRLDISKLKSIDILKAGIHFRTKLPVLIIEVLEVICERT